MKKLKKCTISFRTEIDIRSQLVKQANENHRSLTMHILYLIKTHPDFKK